ncbi:hypothetical protein ACFL27_20665 [candidate division CSSED10-310 bacterium]|uniref:TPM domain-containing protein n=1 Tax=candidate division CSSED10-310 bacterium TaxID=2855610 RepID=A0ABV6Z2H4_UNCC1
MKKCSLVLLVFFMSIHFSIVSVVAGKRAEKKEMQRKIIKTHENYLKACQQTQTALLKEHTEEKEIGKTLHNVTITIYQNFKKIGVQNAETIQISELKPTGKDTYVVILVAPFYFDKPYRNKAGSMDVCGVQGWRNRFTPIDLIAAEALLMGKDENKVFLFKAKCPGDLELLLQGYVVEEVVKAAYYARKFEPLNPYERRIKEKVGPNGTWKPYIGILHPWSEISFRPMLISTLGLGRITLYKCERSGSNLVKTKEMGTFIYKDGLFFDYASECSEEISEYMKEEQRLRSILKLLLKEGREKFGNKFVKELQKQLNIN